MIFICTITTFVCSIGIIRLGINWNEMPISSNSYYDTSTFRYRFDRLLNEVISMSLQYKSEGNIEDGNAINREELIQSFKNYYNIMDGVITQNTEINKYYNRLYVTGEIPEELQENFEEYKNLVETKLPQYRKIYIQSQLAEFKSIKEELAKYNNFLYYVEDESGNKIAGNTSKNTIMALERNITIEGSFASDNIGVYSGYQNAFLAESNDRLYAGIKSPLMPSDVFFYENNDFEMAKNLTPVLMGLILGSCMISILLIFYLIWTAGQSERGGEIKFIQIDRMYNDIHIVLIIITGFVSIFLQSWLINGVYYNNPGFWSYFISVLWGLLFVVDIGIVLSFILSMTRQIKAKQFFKHTLIVTTARKIISLFSGKIFRAWMVLVMLAYGAVNGFLFIFFDNAYGGEALLILLLLIGFNCASIFLFVKALGSLTKIMAAAKETGKGNLNNKLDITKISPSFINFAKDIAGIQSGLKKAVEEAVKGERMKAELITNVSHDLKTPLTSIITYVDLLKKENLENESARNYVSVLDEKSARLKQLIEDLIEASKASSGNLTVTKQKVELRQLVMQASGELEEKIEKAGLHFRISSDSDTFVCADGRHMWRIVENLLSNTIKYSMPNSRVYVDIIKTETMGVLVIKNISEMPIEVTAEQLTERFVRGDESRTTEGSGLGLSIAKSLTLLQNGSFGINIDGDLFKATVKMPLWVEEETSFDQKIDGNNMGNSTADTAVSANGAEALS